MVGTRAVFGLPNRTDCRALSVVVLRFPLQIVCPVSLTITCLPRGFLLCWVVVLAPLCQAQRGDTPDALLKSPEEEQALFHLPPGFEIQLVAAEAAIQKPMNIAFDGLGRVWVTGSKHYPWPAKRDAVGAPIASFQKNWDDNNLAFRAASTPPDPAEHGLDTVRVLSNFDPVTGRAREFTVFADGLNIPIGVLPLPRVNGAKGDTVLVYSIPAIWRLTDTDGDGRADLREKLYDGFGFKDTHGMSANYWLWFDGWVYGTHGFANPSEVVDRAGRVVKLTSGNTYRFRPDGSRFEVFVNGQTNPFGLAFDTRGDLYTADSHSKPVYLLIPGGFYEGINKVHDGLGFAPAITTDDHGSSAIAGIAHYSAAHFPPEFRDNLFNGNPVTRRINRTRLEWRGSTPAATRQSDFLSCDDPAFRPVQVKLGPDGALWIADFYNPIIGHYEVPLTHPGRDYDHGRLWRIVWRGLDRSVALPTLPNLASQTTAELATRLSDENLVVRSLALNELMLRSDAAAASVGLEVAATRLVAGADSTAGGTAVLPVFFALERLGRLDDAMLLRAFARPESAAAHAALRVLAERAVWPAELEKYFASMVGGNSREPAAGAATPGYTWRLVAEALARRPQPWGVPLLLGMLNRAPEADAELVYALRLALKNHALEADAKTLANWAAASAGDGARIADLCLALTTPAAARFLTARVRDTKIPDPRIGEFARHVASNLPPSEWASLVPLLAPLSAAPDLQRLLAAEGFAAAAAEPTRVLPVEVDSWMLREMFAALEEKAAWAVRAANALKPLSRLEKAGPLQRRALAASAAESTRAAAIRALAIGAPETEHTAVAVLMSNAPQGARRAAAEVLGTGAPSVAALSALAGAFAGASADLALTLATSLAKSEAGANDLLELAAAGRVRPALLRHRYVALALEPRSEGLRNRVVALTKSLPPEDARLDALVAYRIGALANFKPDRGQGAVVFATNCASCHRFQGIGGNLGPSLDGIGSRAPARLVEDILDPSRNVDPAFRLTTLTLQNGETRTGLNFRDEGARVFLRDPSSGEEIVVSKLDIAATQPSAISPMPAAFETVLSEQDFFDLLDFLRNGTP